MAGETIQYKRTVKGSVGAGMGALFNGSGRQYFILQHKDTSRYHQAGESQKIIIDQIELGRSKDCQIRYDDETWPIVSRRHAAIEKDATGWKIVPLSQTNSTLVNGKVVNTAWYLQNGDEIQLSIGGPRLGFIVPAGNQSLVSSIKLTERLNLFRDQALRPYKAAISVLCSVLVLACCVGGFFIWSQSSEIVGLKRDMENGQAAIDTLVSVLNTKEDEIKRLNKRLSGTTSVVEQQRSIIEDLIVSSGRISDESLLKALKSVYYVRTSSAKITLPNGKSVSLDAQHFPSLYRTGTGFLLNDGKFVTARHVVDGTKFISSLEEDLDLVYLNVAENSGAIVEITFEAYSPNGSFTFTNKDCIIDNRTDQRAPINLDTNEDGVKDVLTVAMLNNTDWAYVNTHLKGTLKVNKNVKQTIKRDTKLIVLGYPGGYVTKNVEALEGSCVIAANGLQDGLIVVTDRNFEQGNSGGPVLIVRPDRTAEVVGIVSSGYGNTVGHIVSITNLK